MKNVFYLLFLFTNCLISQNELPQDYFGNPLDIELILAGDFGEIRSNHFHSGVDIKTNQKEGYPIYAAADGYVNRINVKHYGYGKALYLKHPNGYSTVYAHLQSYAGEIEKYVKQNQYSKETFEIELFPSSNVLQVKKGDIIAYSGNTGSSSGPHLHYEIRDANSRPMNPMLFGMEIPDSKTPNIMGLFAYPIDEDSHVNQSQNRQKIRLIKLKDGNYTTEKITAEGKIGFGIATHDQQDGASNKNGVYKIKSVYNGKEKYEVIFDKFSFGETRYINRYIDYEYEAASNMDIQKLFREKNNPLSLINLEDENGFVTVQDSTSSLYMIDVLDFKGNKTSVNIPIQGKNLDITDAKSIKKTDDYISADHSNSITKGKFSIFIPANSLYEDAYLNIQAKGDTLIFHEDVIPIHQNISISMDISGYTDVDKDKLFISRLNYRRDPYYNSTRRNGDKLTAKVRKFGNYSVAMDTTAPKIRALNFSEGKWISKENTLELKISDDFSGISSYHATINGKFILMEYNFKNNVLTYNFEDAIISEAENNLKLIVIDNVGNSATFEAKFFRKNT